MKLYRAVFFFVAFFGVLYSEERIGKLDNGLTYYIKHNEFPKEKASLRLIVKVGSIYETEEERGIAHFLEHMVFRGSENFTDWEIINYLESIGAEFGADTNAYTSFEETCYVLEVPLGKKESLDKAILMLSDFAGRASLKDELIEKERNVVMDEYNSSQKQSATRIHNSMHKEFFANSAYADRMPIGDKEVILHADPSILRNFYKKWYRPNRMAVIAVGDFDVDLIQNRIKECFNDLTPGDETNISTAVTFPYDVRSLFICEEEERFIQGGLTQFYEARCPLEISEEQLKQGLIYSITSSILNYRLDALSKEHPAPYLAGGMISYGFTTFHEALRLHFIGFMDRPLDGLRAICKEVERLRKYGPTKGELEREISRREEENSIGMSNIDRTENGVFIQAYTNHYLCGIHFDSLHSGYELNRKFLKDINSQDIINWLDSNIDIDRMYRIFSMPFINVITQSDVEQVIQEVKSEKLEPPKEILNSLLSVATSGFVDTKSVVSNPNTGSLLVKLDNGIKVVFHPTSLEKGRVSIDLIAASGKTMFKPEDYNSVEIAPYYLMESGLANLNGTELRNFMQKRDCSFNFTIGSNHRSIETSGPTVASEVLLQLIRALFLEKRFDSEIWSSIIDHHLEIQKYKNNQPEVFFIETANQIIYDNHPFYMARNISEANEELAKKCVQTAFNNPLDFSVVIVGDFDMDEMQTLVAQYFHFSNIVNLDKPEIILPILKDLIQSRDEIIYKGKETHGSTIMCFRKFCKNQIPTALSMKALSHILGERCMKKMRQDLGDTYSVSFLYEIPLEPNMESICAYVYFTSNPEKAESLRAIALDVIDEFIKNGPTDEEVSSAKEILSQRVKEAKGMDAFWRNLHMQAELHDRHIDELLLEKENLEIISQLRLQALAKEIFDQTSVVNISLFPEKG